MFFSRTKTTLPAADEALAGRSERPFHLAARHLVLDAPLVTDDIPEGYEAAIFGLGCFWGAEELYWKLPGVWSTSVGYAGGYTAHPSYEEVCSGRTGHTEAVRVVFDPSVVSYGELVKRFFEVHDPTQGMRQGNDVGTQYRSAIYATTPEQEKVAHELTEEYGAELTRLGFDPITTEIKLVEDAEPAYFYAEDYHQQYLAKNPNGYRCHSTTGVAFPGIAVSDSPVAVRGVGERGPLGPPEAKERSCPSTSSTSTSNGWATTPRSGSAAADRSPWRW